MEITLISRRLAVAAVTLALTGCAVAQIDVDVYKGPLSNHEDVQLKQLEAMVVAARPLLEQLKVKVKGDAPTVKRIDAILTLYRDLADPELKPFTTLLDVQSQRYGEAVERLISTKNEAGEIWPQIKYGMVLDVYEEAHVRKLGVQDTDVEKAKTALKELKRRYGCFFTLGHDPNVSECKFNYRSQDLPKYSDELRAYVPHIPVTQEPPIGNTNSINSNAEFAWLSTERFLNQERVLLFPSPRGFEADIFANEAKNAADAFFESRDALREMWHGTLDAILLVNRRERLADRRQEYTEALAHLAANLMQPRHVIAASLTDGPNGPGDELVSRFRKIGSSEGWEQGYWQKARKVKRDDSWCFGADKAAASTRTIARTIVEDPVGIVKLLLKADNEFRNADFSAARTNYDGIDELNDCFKESYLFDKFGSAVSDRSKTTFFGLVRGPTISKAAIKELERALAPIRAAFAAQGLEEGRDDKGLISLINDHREIVKKFGQDNLSSDELRQSFSRFRDGLVSFAQKVLALANSQSLLEGAEANDRFVLNLQSIGNTILFQADELTHRYEHDDKLKAAKGREKLAVERTYSVDPVHVLDDLMAGLSDGNQPKIDQTKIDATQHMLDEKVNELQGTDGKGGKVAELATVEQALKQAKLAFEPIEKPCKQSNAANQLIVLGAAVGAQTGICAVPLNPAFVRNIHDKITAISKFPDDSTWDAPHAWAAVQSEVKQMLAREASARAGTTSSSERDALTDALTVFNSLDGSNYKSTKRAGVLGEVNDAISAKLAGELTRATNSQEAATLRAAEENVADAKAENLNIQGEISGLKSQIAQLEGKQLSQRALDAIEELRSATLEVLRRRGQPVTPGDVFDELIKELKAARERASSSGVSSSSSHGSSSKDAASGSQPSPPAMPVTPVDRQSLSASNSSGNQSPKPPTEALEKAIEMVNAAPRPRPSPTNASTGAKDAKDILDDVIAGLRQEQIETVRKFGKDSQQAINIESAIKIAYEQRASMTYIRPSDAYLRSSLPAAGLQDNVGTAWENLLAQHLGRGVPLFGFQAGQTNEVRNRVIRDLDKQFWVNINRVRVSGAGTTNYAIAKDDIGNWYVKAFATDTSDIVNAAKNLALFNLGPSVGANLVSGRRPAATSGNGAADAPSGEASASGPGNKKTTLELLFDKYEKRFDDRTEKVRQDVVEALGSGEHGISAEVVSKWNNAIDDPARDKLNAEQKAKLKQALKSIWDKEFAGLSVAAERAGATQDREGQTLKGTEVLSNVVFALNEVRRLGGNVVQQTAQYRLPSDAEASGAGVPTKEEQQKEWQELTTAASAQARTVIGTKLRSLQSDQSDVVDEFESALALIGDAAKE